MHRITVFLLLAISIGACVKSQQGPGPTPDVRVPDVTVWAKRDPAAPLLPRAAARAQILVTEGEFRGDHLLWIIADGTQIHAVHQLSANELGEAVALVFQQAEQQGLRFFTVGDASQGFPGGPKPGPGPGPPGKPPGELVQDVIKLSQQLNNVGR